MDFIYTYHFPNSIIYQNMLKKKLSSLFLFYIITVYCIKYHRRIKP